MKMHHSETIELATLIFEKVDRAYEDSQFIDALLLTQDIYGLDTKKVPNVSRTSEFYAVCNAIDFLIEEGSIWFDTRDGSLHRA